jgi:hypothetical protein
MTDSVPDSNRFSPLARPGRKDRRYHSRRFGNERTCRRPRHRRSTSEHREKVVVVSISCRSSRSQGGPDFWGDTLHRSRERWAKVRLSCRADKPSVFAISLFDHGGRHLLRGRFGPT